MNLAELIWLIPAFPLLGVVLLLIAGPKMGERAGWLATAMMGGAFVSSVVVFAGLLSLGEEEREVTVTLFRWIPAGAFSVDIGFLADPLSITMCLFVTGVGALIHLYSIGYMHGDPKFSKYFLYLNLFAFSMLMLVTGSNLLVTFLGWEGVGACSYFLIAFWYRSEVNAAAGKKAFITNRVGDVGFMLGTFLVFTTIGSLNYLDISAAAAGITGATAIAIALLFFMGAVGKSAQLPLLVWLPDAMAGPTPVSALIHAATMVTSGVYLLVRLNPILFEAAWANDVIAWVGVLTAFWAATVALAQNDIKKVLAYSTISQLGYTFLAVGTGAYGAAIFHVVTHAFFKGLLFLGAGSVIHSLHGDQDMRRMGGLRKYLPITSATFIIGWLAIAGVPPFSGFWSKDDILAGAWEFGPSGKVLWALGLLTALLTAFYMTRQVILVFFGDERFRPEEVAAEDAAADAAAAVAAGEGDVEVEAAAVLVAAGGGPDARGTDWALVPIEEPREEGIGLEAGQDPHESPPLMWIPLVALAGLALIGGLLSTPFSTSTRFLEQWIEPVLAHPHEAPGASTLITLAVIAVITALLGIAAGYGVYLLRKADPRRIEPNFFRSAWHYDEGLSAFVAGPGRRFFDGLAEFDRQIIDGAVNGLGRLSMRDGRYLSRLQTGQLRRYVLGLSVGAATVLVYFVTRMTI
ncbi:NADH-quinone oxidoreductase subunit L [Candidatus Neomicrothrix sp.]|jgi:NADH-quinone oxidoreductase subunit L|uniref:NADH-quinone oxidoreductase subunit L n=1 Tax=Candidatus Neomicrothrix subdominans TaxID=2954438 RepID=A0A936TCV5_9ACTN|nr:NADH-quinone oxidoreductase subunit L [Candidatus Microthrix sp.]MBK9295422.1 NADH-quinone oxidoreductase subunit L [Candidatus Microthrix subdominans]MBK6311409.1 NADH-quinone oxidoreductase subunit L [Candidatus Microthrix sp.]MBK6438212.1 NADH-quinone oxidoreductase subunit L [Candidatus Microthrix sp.]MBK6970897.1 NADH-quinone oxidoreductase subunit L [Candidatus Microthrix sp.]MBK7165467.1 NADH-quinone oxidoreductase subunit L [Candidatus Microthrix sp.]